MKTFKTYTAVALLLFVSVCSAQQKIKLEDVIAQNKGKVVVVDFWASWCAPCRKEIPSVKKIVKHYKDSDVVFVFISMDIEKDKWQEAAAKEGIADLSTSYMVGSFQKSDLTKLLNINSIPRYVVFDNEGKLAIAEAPRPSDGKKLRNEIDTYLKQ